MSEWSKKGRRDLVTGEWDIQPGSLVRNNEVIFDGYKLIDENGVIVGRLTREEAESLFRRFGDTLKLEIVHLPRYEKAFKIPRPAVVEDAQLSTEDL